MKKILLYFFLVGINHSLIAQVNTDSLLSIWNNNSLRDTVRLAALHKLAGDGYLFKNPDSTFFYAQLAYDFSKSIGNKKWMGKALNMQGISFSIRGNYNEALRYYQKSLDFKISIGDKIGVAKTYTNIGII